MTTRPDASRPDANRPDANRPDASWIELAADEVERQAAKAGSGDGVLVCASGISPSGPIHLGNLREVMTAHLVAEELKRRGRRAGHLHSWDDYDRLRKVPAGVPGVDGSYAEHIGRPLSAVPDPCGAHDSWATHFIAAFTAELDELGIAVRHVRQSERYPRGDYNSAIRVAMERRGETFDILAKYQTVGRHADPADARRAAYYPFKPYCEHCGRDTTTVLSYADAKAAYRCACDHTGEIDLSDGAKISGKLVWKVDWPMRWRHERVDFEPAGEDHHAPTSSYSSGREIVATIFGGTAPYSFAYSFVGLTGGSSKMSSSTGGAAVPSTALEVLEPAMLRWLYARRPAAQSFSIDLTARGVQRLYDEWDRFLDRSEAPDASGADRHLREICLRTSTGPVLASRRRVSFRMLASVADITQGNPEQTERIVRAHLAADAAAGGGAGAGSADDATEPDLRAALNPRLDLAVNYATSLLSPDERTHVRTGFDADAWAGFDDDTRRGIGLLAAGLADHWDLETLTKLVYGVPKVLLGLPEDVAPSPELKRTQRQFFIAVYRLLVGADTGPRLPTLMLSIGQDTTRRLLTPPG